ncbi:MAG: DNA repair protein [Pseudomonadota bacterium]
MAALAVTGVVLVIVTLLSATGVLPWLELSAQFGSGTWSGAGMALQIGATAVVVLMSVFIPSNVRVLRLENSHREFRLAMEDILQAYELAHAGDRAAAFSMTSEFDSVRERYEYLRAHPDLEALDGELLTVAAQMSHQSRDLARVYSDDKIARVRDGLEKRRADAEALEARIQSAHAGVRDIRRMLDDVEIEESAIDAQIRRLQAEVTDLIAASTQGAVKSANSSNNPRLRSVKAGARLADTSS